MSYKTLYILRHAKAVALSGDMDDHERPLSPRGEAEVERLGAFMLQRGINPQLIICSTALRTRMTLQALEKALDRPLRTHFSAKLYLASPKNVMEELAGVGQEVRSVLVIGHNPTVHQLTVELVESGEEKMLDALAQGFPTAAFAEIQYPAQEWSELGQRAGILRQFVTPAELVGA